jgi:hypothetical protein
MMKFADSLKKSRERATAARATHDDLKEALELREAALYLSMDYKGLGSNEGERKMRFTEALGSDIEYCRLKGQLNKAEVEKYISADALTAIEDARRDYENGLRVAFLKAKYGYEEAENYADFEESVMADEYFQSVEF